MTIIDAFRAGVAAVLAGEGRPVGTHRGTFLNAAGVASASHHPAGWRTAE